MAHSLMFEFNGNVRVEKSTSCFENEQTSTVFMKHSTWTHFTGIIYYSYFATNMLFFPWIFICSLQFYLINRLTQAMTDIRHTVKWWKIAALFSTWHTGKTNHWGSLVVIIMLLPSVYLFQRNATQNFG